MLIIRYNIIIIISYYVYNPKLPLDEYTLYIIYSVHVFTLSRVHKSAGPPEEVETWGEGLINIGGGVA